MFCKIVAGDLPSHKLLEDDDFVAFLSIFPKCPGMTMIVTKKHFGSYLYQSLDDELFTKMHLFAKKMGLILDKALGFDRCMQVMEGFDIDHAHLKLFPVRVGNRPSLDAQDVRANDEELSIIAEKIRKVV